MPPPKLWVDDTDNEFTSLEDAVASIKLLRKLLAEKNQEIMLLKIRNEHLEFPQEQRKQHNKKAWWENLRQIARGGQLIYFIRAGTDTSIKIGLTATSSKKRKKGLQTGNHRPLQTILEVEGADGVWERAFHVLVVPWHVEGTGTEWFDFGPLVDCFIENITEKPRDIGELLQAVEEFVAKHRPDHLAKLKDDERRREQEQRQKEADKIQGMKDWGAAKAQQLVLFAQYQKQQNRDRKVIPFSVAYGKVPKIAHWQIAPITDIADSVYNYVRAMSPPDAQAKADALERDALGRFKRAL
jgi:hypothetical protein